MDDVGTEFVLGDEPDAVPRARRFAAEALSAEPSTTVDDAEVIVTELVTNALLHGGPPVSVRLSRLDDRIRIEVEDTGRHLPVRGGESTDAMTGRGIGLVSALAAGWGNCHTADCGRGPFPVGPRL